MKAAFLLFAATLTVTAEPISLHPENPRYFLYRGKPTVLITSGEHYGAVVNLDFDYRKYLDTLAGDGLNNTRIFSGAYVEPMGAFNIARNTLAPADGKFIAPWARSKSEGGNMGGGNRFDLTRWNENYFKRLRDFVRHAEDKGVVVEMNLFCPFYEEGQWRLSPMNARNNVNGYAPDVSRTNVYTLDKSGELLQVQEEMTRKIVQELNEFDSLYYEICNEPYFGGVTLEWQHRIAEVIAETEKSLPKKHLISRNVANDKAKVDKTHPAVSIYNFHYAFPPDTVAMNYALNKPIGDNETGFRGTNDLYYRMEAWAFLLAGGALYNNLDYSFVAGHEDGTFVYPASQPGGGNPVFRKQMKYLAEFMRSLEFVKMKPQEGIVTSGLPGGARAYGLAREGDSYAVYVTPVLENPQGKGLRGRVEKEARSVELELAVPPGVYMARWINPVDGKAQEERVEAREGRVRVHSPAYAEDLALSLRRVP